MNIRTASKISVILTAGAILGGCATLDAVPPTQIHQPAQAPVIKQEPYLATPGSLYTPQVRSLFEDRRARRVGDTLTINLVEKNVAQKSSKASAGRDSSISGGIKALGRLPLKTLNGLDIEAGGSSEFEGEGGASANNLFNGTITVTVIEVMGNGNMLVAGEKQMAINQGAEFIRFSGVVNPVTVSSGNTVQSTQVADARIEYKGSGYIDEAQRMGWLQRFFTIISPF